MWSMAGSSIIRQWFIQLLVLKLATTECAISVIGPKGLLR
jgi:hypothetical protein